MTEHNALQKETIKNPFLVHTPEDLSAQDVVSLFVSVFTDFPKIQNVGHTFVNGPRGCGKSMMFRYLRPDCQLLSRGGKLKELEFFGIHIPIKKTNPTLTDLLRLKNQHANVVINEHFLTIYMASLVFESFSPLLPILEDEDKDGVFVSEMRKFVNGSFGLYLEQCGWSSAIPEVSTASLSECFSIMKRVCDSIYRQVVLYLRRIALPQGDFSYTGALCSYLDFLYPLLSDLKQMPFMPPGPIYLLVDDADNLNKTQTMVLNSWVSTRTSKEVSFKISTQLSYKTYMTISGRNVDSIHDYSEINISTIYTSSRNKYRERVREIVSKRLEQAGINVSPENFFPRDEKQEREIEEIAERLKAVHATEGRGNRPRDDATRYARPIYMAGLKGKSKSLSSYSYAGFDQLVHISDGLIRYFLEPAARMFEQEVAESNGNVVDRIAPNTQHEIIYEESEKLAMQLLREAENLDNEPESNDHHFIVMQKLSTLIHSLGGLFHVKLMSNDAERRVFSIFLSDQPDTEVKQVLRLGVTLGYFHETTLGNKEGTGRNRLYVLTRRLAPFFRLDPFGFAGYQSVTNSYLKIAMRSSKHLRQAKERGVDKFIENTQPSLFDESIFDVLALETGADVDQP